MNTYDKIRLLKIDTQLLEVEEQIAAAQESERGASRAYFAPSKALRYKHARLSKMRMNLIRSVNDKLTRRETYDMILNERKLAVIAAENQIINTERDIVALMGTIAFGDTESKLEQLKTLRRVLASQKMILVAKERAVQNWLAKDSDSLPIKRSNTLISTYEVLKEELKEKIVKQDIYKQQNFELNISPSHEVKEAFVDKPKVKANAINMLMNLGQEQESKGE